MENFADKDIHKKSICNIKNEEFDMSNKNTVGSLSNRLDEVNNYLS